MDIGEKYIVEFMIRTLEGHLMNVSPSRYATAFADAKKEFFKRKMCESISANIRDEYTLLIVVQSRGRRHVMVWDMKKKSINYEGRRTNAAS